MTLILEKCEGYCRGVDGRAGPNLACAGCGRAVATRIDDCGSWQTVWLEPDAVVRGSSGLPAGPGISEPRSRPDVLLAPRHPGTVNQAVCVRGTGGDGPARRSGRRPVRGRDPG